MTTANVAIPVRDVEQVLRDGGLSRFHKKAILVTGAAWTFVAMEILLVGFVAPIFAAKWGLNGRMQGLVNSAALAGSLVGSLTLGRLADRIGRRTIFQYSILWYALFTAGTALAWGPWSVMSFRFLAGLGLGGMLVVDPSMLTEYLPPQRRGRLLVFLDFWWPVGLLVATGLSWVFIGHNVGGAWSWRWLFVAASFPALMAFVVRRSLPESPYFLARQGRTQEAAEVLSEITGRHVEPGELTVPEEPRSSMRELLSERLRSRAVTTALVWIALNISYYGLFLWLPFVLQAEKSFSVNVYLLLTLSALSQFPGYAAAIWLVERVGRKPTLATFLVLGGVSAYAFAVADTSSVYITALFFVGFFNLGAWGAVYPYTSETFPTRLRSSAFGLMEGVGKTAAIAGPYIFGHLKDATGSTTWSLTFVAIVMAAGGLVAAVFGRETRGRALA
ncbi:MAG: transporter, putative metabolite:H+ symporter [Gaiellaceae bacterium]|jgi:putative MFS transporter|nr:transporter, putative metabolite:H+ symporter [Gaiellaceae bacterium]